MAITKPSAAPRTPQQASAGRGQRRVAATLLLSPFFVLFGFVTLIPIGYAAWLSLYTQHRSGLGFGGVTSVFSGLANYASVLDSGVFRDGFAHIAVFALLYVPLMLAGSLVVALLLDSALARAKRFFQLTIFLPHVVPGILAALIWLYLYTPQVSPVVHLLEAGGIPFNPASSSTAVPALANVAIWEVLGYNIVIFYAALQAIPRELLEAAVIDGASEMRTSLNVKLPLIRSSVGLVLLFTGINVVQLFNEPLMLNLFGGSAISSQWTPNMYNYSAALKDLDYGRAAAGSLLVALVSGLLSFAITRFFNPWKRV